MGTLQALRPRQPADPAGIVEERSRVAAAAPALVAPDRAPLTYGELHRQLQRIGAVLLRAGVARHKRAAIVLPNSSEMAVAVLAASSCATCAPLNPAYREDEFRFFLGALWPKVLILSATDQGAARIVADEMRIPCLDAHLDSMAPAGVFEISGADALTPAGTIPANGDDIALILHTSGTTSRPKIVPLTHRNLVRSAANIASQLALQPDDRCLNLMPLFHIHGFVAALLASLSAGVSVACVPGMQKGCFAAWVRELRPTWYTAVPTMH